MIHLVLTVIAQDQTGLVERIAQCIAAHQGNWLESRMARMAGQFAGILRVAVPAAQRTALVAALQGLEQQGMRIQLVDSGNEPGCPARQIRLSLRQQFQEVGGTALVGDQQVPVEDATLRGSELRFALRIDGRVQTFQARVEGGRLQLDPPWRATRAAMARLR